MDEIRIDVRRTRTDIWKGITANLLRSASSYVSSVAAILFLTGLAIFVNIDEGVEPAIIAGSVVFVGMIALYALIYAFCIFLAVRKTVKLPGAFESVGYTFSPEGLGAVATSGQGRSSWDMWPLAFETKSLFVIRHQLNLIQIIPKRELTGGQTNAVRAALTRYVKKTSLQVPSE